MWMLMTPPERCLVGIVPTARRAGVPCRIIRRPARPCGSSPPAHTKYHVPAALEFRLAGAPRGRGGAPRHLRHRGDGAPHVAGDLHPPPGTDPDRKSTR